jgi:hypothetical protein
MDGMALQGDLETMGTGKLLGLLAQVRASGTLSLSRGMIVRRFHLDRGRIVIASSSEEETLLGRLLVDRGLIDEAQLASALEARGRSRARLGKALIEEGLVSAKDLAAVLAEKVQLLIEDALGWTDGRFFFDDRRPPKRTAGVAAIVDLEALLADAPLTLTVADGDVVEETALVPPLASGELSPWAAGCWPRWPRTIRAASEQVPLPAGQGVF